MGSIRPRWRPLAVAMFAAVMGVCAVLPLRALAQTSPVQEAHTLYEQAQFDQAISLLRDALMTGRVTGAEAEAARELLARCLVRKGDRLEAKEAFKGLLHLNPHYRPAPGALPPDELEVYRLAHSEFAKEEIEAGERVPASLSFSYGVGSGANKNLGEVVAAGGGNDKFDSDPSFGGAVRFPIRPRWSVEIELQRFRATDADSFPGDQKAHYEVTALPLSFSLYYAAMTNPKWRVNVFGGLGALLAATSSIRFNFGTLTLAVTDEKTGFYGHAGIEGEYLVTPRFAAYGRLLGRVATAGNLYPDFPLDIYGSTSLKGRKVDFSGFGAHVGLRAYIGY